MCRPLRPTASNPSLRLSARNTEKQLGGIRAYLSAVDGSAAMETLKTEGKLTFDVDGVEISLAGEDLLIDMAQKGGFVAEADNYVTVVLDTNLTEELIEEGFVYEVISKIQNMRKDADSAVFHAGAAAAGFLHVCVSARHANAGHCQFPQISKNA